ncbi:MAG: hypothetical protein Q9226_001972, partial [Calogaya cf. arnoldii]
MPMKMLRCSFLDPQTKIQCNKTYSRPFSLKRHVTVKHAAYNITTTFIDCNPESQRPITYHTTSKQTTPVPTALQPTAADEPDVRPFKIRRQSGHNDVASSPQSQRSIESVEDADDLAGLPPCESPDSYTSGNKRKRSIDGFSGGDRLHLSRLAPPMPIYDVKMSTKIQGQPKGLEWRSQAAKHTFDMDHCRRRAEWGVNMAHRGTCILIPEDWKTLDPLEMLKLFDLDNCPSVQAARLRFYYSDHGTAFARALAWFAKWPRSGLEQDNFMGDGECKPMDASHTCHHDTCIVHVTYEPTHVNHDRKNCCGQARKLRQEGEEIPEHCEHHNPPCLLQ